MSAAVAPAFGALFLGAHRRRRPSLRRRLAVLLSVLAHLAVVVVLVRWRPSAAEEAPPPVREPIFLRLAPPPSAPRVAAVAARRPARRPQPRPALVQPPSEPLPPPPDPEPAPEEVEPEVEDSAAEEAPLAEAAPAAPPAGGGRPGGLPGGDGDAVLELRQVARPPVLLEQEKPVYPPEARWKRVEGLVLVRVTIGVDGHIERGSAKVVRSVPGLDGAALAAIERWRFSPAIGHGGRPVRVAIEVPFNFTLR